MVKSTRPPPPLTSTVQLRGLPTRVVVEVDRLYSSQDLGEVKTGRKVKEMSMAITCTADGQRRANAHNWLRSDQ